MFAVDRDGRKFTKIYGSKEEIGEKRTALQIPLANDAAADIVSLLDREADNILIARMPRRAHWLHRTYDPDGKPWLVRLNIHTGERDTVGQAPLASATVIVDHEDQPRFAIGVNDTSKLSVAWKRAADAQWEAFELPGYREGTVRPRCFTADNRSVLFTAIREGERYAALFQLELADRSVKQLIDVPGADVLELVNDPMTKETIGVVGYTDKLIYRWMTSDHPTARALQAMLRAFEGSEVSLVSHSADGRRSIVFVQSDVAPGEYFLFDAQAKKADMIAPARRWIDSQAMRPKEPVSIKARDGLLLQGYVTRPAGSAPYPLVVLPHSGPHHVRDMWGFDPQVQLLANRGYAVLQVNYRGSGGLGVDFEQAGYRQWGAKMQDDVTDATSWAIEQKIAAPERVCIYGVGYGGYAALMGTVREPTLYRCAIGFAGIYDLELMLDSEATAQSQLGSHYFETIIGSDPTKLQARSPASQAANITAPVLLIHGEEGLLADDKQAIRMKAALEQAGKHVESLRPFGGKRDVHDAGAQVQVLHALLEFLDRHLMEPDFAAN
jgi:dipeptidyl aminopeptidase/acylaminoacyl peptidase